MDVVQSNRGRSKSGSLSFRVAVYKARQWALHESEQAAKAQKLGVQQLIALCEQIALPQTFAGAASLDKTLSNIALQHWDKHHASVYELARTAKLQVGWTITDSVNVLKHVARNYVVAESEARRA
jgi:hypothetical protein